MNADKTGAVVERVQAGRGRPRPARRRAGRLRGPGGMHPGAGRPVRRARRVRPGIVAMGEDLDLCWRAQVAGARVVVAPEAGSATSRPGRRGPPGRPPADGSEAADPPGPAAPPRAAGGAQVLLLVPPAAGGAPGRRCWPWARWWWPWSAGTGPGPGPWSAPGAGTCGHLGELRAAPRAGAGPAAGCPTTRCGGCRSGAAPACRPTSPASPTRGSTWPTAASPAEGARRAAQDDEEPVLTGSVGLAFSEDADFDELDDLGPPLGPGPLRPAPAPADPRPPRRPGWWSGLVAVVVLLVGTRDLFGRRASRWSASSCPCSSWSAHLAPPVRRLAAGRGGHHRPGDPGLRRPRGARARCCWAAWGWCRRCWCSAASPSGPGAVSRLLRPLASPRARLAGAVAYLGLPLAYDALAQGRWDGLVAYAAVPWILVPAGPGHRPAPPFAAARRPRPVWRAHPAGQMLCSGGDRGGGGGLGPGRGPGRPLCAAWAWCWARSLVGEWRGAAAGPGRGRRRPPWWPLVLLAPGWWAPCWPAGRRVGVFGLTGRRVVRPQLVAQLVRFAVGPDRRLAAQLAPGRPPPCCPCSSAARPAWPGPAASGRWPVCWLGPGLGLGPGVDRPLLAVGRRAAGPGRRRRGRLRSGSGVARPSRPTCRVTGSAGARWRPRRRRGARLVGLVPVVVEAGGRPLGPARSPATPSPLASSRPAVGRHTGPAATGCCGWATPGPCPSGVVDRARAWPTPPRRTARPTPPTCGRPAGPGPASTVADAVSWPPQGAPASWAGCWPRPRSATWWWSSRRPRDPGASSPSPSRRPADLLTPCWPRATSARCPGGGRASVFANTAYVPERASRAARPGPGGSAGRSWPTPADRRAGPRAARADRAPRYAGPVGAGTVYAAYAPAGGWSPDRRRAGPCPGTGLRLGGPVRHGAARAGPLLPDLAVLVPLGVLLEVLLWLVVAAALLGRRRGWTGGGSRWRRAAPRRRAGRPPRPPWPAAASPRQR